MRWPFGRRSETKSVPVSSSVAKVEAAPDRPLKRVDSTSEFEDELPFALPDQLSIKILFVCTGNICRSAAGSVIAKAARNAGRSNWRIDSAGTGALVGCGVEPEIAAALEEFGIRGIEDHVAKQLSFRLLEAADLILIFDESHFRWVLNEAPQVVDKILPLRKLATLLEDGVKTVEQVKRENLKIATRPSHWLDDPYRRGPDVARTCVSQILHDLEIIIANLKNDSPKGAI